MSIYTFAIPQFHITQPRASRADTLFAATGLKVMNANGGLHNDLGSQSVALGDGNAGMNVSCQLSWRDVDVPDPTPENPDGGAVYWTFLAVNNGHSDSGWIDVLNKGADAFAGAMAGGVTTAGSWQQALAYGGSLVATLGLQELMNCLTANCDGNVAVEGLVFTAKQLSQMASGLQFWSLERDYPGTNSPVGCGANSDYQVAYYILPPGVDIPGRRMCYGDTALPGNLTTLTPGLAVFNNKLYALYRSGGDDSMWFAWYDGATWQGDIRLPGNLTSASPALAAYRNQLYALYKSSGNDGSLWFAWFDGANWQGDIKVSSGLTSASPALAVYNNLLYAVYKSHSDNSMWYAWFDGARWHGDIKIPLGLTSAAPTLAVYNGKLYLLYRSQSDDTMWFAWFDGSHWNGDIRLPGNLTSAAPALAAYDNQLYAVYRSSGDDSIWIAWFDGSDWRGDVRLMSGRPQGPQTGTAPAAVAYDNKLYMVYRSPKDTSMWYCWTDR